ncbi:hypothetical protein C8R47DRAFT_1116533 [Mycena vitilis]|nr:hypothetical protein C8R47DRAFT_1116533 [Mycena vitilis]
MADINAIATQFITFYYQTFDSCYDPTDNQATAQANARGNLAALYRDNSMLSFEGAQIAGTNAIVEKLVSLPFKESGVKHNVTTSDAQPSSGTVASLLVSVTGTLSTDPSNPNANLLQFSQVFHLIPEAASYYVLNDIFRLNYA